MGIMNPPEMSVFQGASSIQVANNNTIDEEEEEEQERRRHNLEIQEALDVMFEDEHPDESGQFVHPPSGQGVARGDWLNSHPMQQDHYSGGDEGQLARVFEINAQETYQLKNTLANEVKVRDQEIDKLQKCLAIANAEKERAIMTRSQTNELLIESKAKCSELNSTVARLQSNVQELQKKNSDMLVEIENTNRMLKDSEMQLRLAENNALRRKEQLRDSDRRNAEVELLQQQVNGLLKKVDDREMSLSTMEKKYRELERSREALLVDKTDTINDLMRSLGETQEQCNDLLSRPDLSHENFQLRQSVAALEKQAEEMERRIKRLTKELEDKTETRFLDSDKQLVSSTPLTTDAKYLNVRQELYRALADLKEKREDIRKLQEDVAAKSTEIATLKQANNDSLIKIAESENEIMRLTEKVRLYENESEENWKMKEEGLSEVAQNFVRESQMEIEKLKNEYCSLSSAKNDLVRELNALKSQDFVKNLECLQDEFDDVKKSLQESEDVIKEKDKVIERQKWEHEKEMAKLKEKFEKEKLECVTKRRSLKNDSRDCSNCLNQMADITRQEIENIQLQKDCANYLREINHLKSELKESTETVNDLHARLGLKEEQNRVIADLKEQAAKFGEYIKNCSSTSTPQKVDSRDASVSTSPDMEGFSNPAMYDQYAKVYAEEMKKMEMQFREKELQAEETVKKLVAYRDEMQKVFEEKVHMFKVVILSERKEFERLISEKEFESQRSTEEHSKIVNKYKQDLSVLKGQAEELRHVVKELKEQNEKEKNAVMELMREWSAEKESVKVREMKMQRLIDETAKKYDSAKEKAENYKKYAEAQDVHMKKESERIRSSYEAYKVKIDERLEALKVYYAKLTDEKVAKIEEEYMRKLEMLKRP
ncbi:putative leucine-rich repeat-containing protein DDB_G0290503 [Phlebotomus argentipes]|uniref:putative leucine-rich repeat-containing protein DDB_G0290503 n=1 Tax=Phlebotomus argentipes TaxID=94469 RepID=UPI002892E2A1|nr:putative leucine-rich repeat-containing protein DDB_G0290503 [Phlebotomus argentipes]